MWVIIESISAGLIISLINKYIINKNIFDSCATEQEEEKDEEGSEVVSMATGVSDSSASTHHIHF